MFAATLLFASTCAYCCLRHHFLYLTTAWRRHYWGLYFPSMISCKSWSLLTILIVGKICENCCWLRDNWHMLLVLYEAGAVYTRVIFTKLQRGWVLNTEHVVGKRVLRLTKLPLYWPCMVCSIIMIVTYRVKSVLSDTTGKHYTVKLGRHIYMKIYNWKLQNMLKNCMTFMYIT